MWPLVPHPRAMPRALFSITAAWLGGMALGTSTSLGQTGDESAATIIHRYLDALGGEMALRTVRSVRIVQESFFDSEDGREVIHTERFYQRSRWLVISSDGSKHGFDGQRSWNTTGVRTVDAPHHYRFHTADPVGFPLHLAEFPGTLSIGPLGDQDRYVQLRVTQPIPNPPGRMRMWPLEFHFERDSGLLAKVVFEHGTVEFSDYRPVEDLLVPHTHVRTIDEKLMKATYSTQFLEIEFNLELSDDLFKPNR